MITGDEPDAITSDNVLVPVETSVFYRITDLKDRYHATLMIAIDHGRGIMRSEIR
jgi:regulator of protease activity HflC (stomatin/prohibitin superfamily)